MVTNKVFLATTGKSISKAQTTSFGSWEVAVTLDGVQVNSLITDPFQAGRIYAGTQSEGVLVSTDYGHTWQSAGLSGQIVKSLAVSPHTPGMIYAGCKPVSLFVTQDGGANWVELPEIKRRRRWWWFSPAEPPDFRPYIQVLTISPTDPEVIMAGIELGGVLRSEDGGRTWSKHRSGAVLDCHSLKFHLSNGNWVYQGGGSGRGAAFSRDGGKTFQQTPGRFAERYGWMVAADPENPEIWYLSASGQPNFLRGEFAPPAHRDGQADATIYRIHADGKPEPLAGGLPQPLDYMAYALVTDPTAPGHVYAGLSNGEVWHSANWGDHWEKLPFNLGGIHATMIMLPDNMDLTNSIKYEKQTKLVNSDPR